MIDTIRLQSPAISKKLFEILKSKSIEKIALDNENDIVVYTFTSNDLVGSYDNKIMIQVRDQCLKRFFSLDQGKYLTENFPCDPYLVVELSIHKFFRGHNIDEGFQMLQPLVKKLMLFFSKIFHSLFPDYREWQILRLDYAETFKIDNIENYFKYLNNCTYSRRKISRYDTAIFIPGITTSVRIYSKEHEFKNHDLKKLKNNLNFDIIGLSNRAKNLLRCEVQINKRKIISLNGGEIMLVKNYNLKVIQGCYENEVLKLFQLKEHNRKYNDAKEVNLYLFNNYDRQLASTYFSTYTSLCVFGKDVTRLNMSDSTFYRHMKFFKESGISFTNSDLKIVSDENVYKDFVPTLDSIYKVS